MIISTHNRMIQADNQRLKKIKATSKYYAKPIHESFINKIYDKIMSFEKLGVTENG